MRRTGIKGDVPRVRASRPSCAPRRSACAAADSPDSPAPAARCSVLSHSTPLSGCVKLLRSVSKTHLESRVTHDSRHFRVPHGALEGLLLRLALARLCVCLHDLDHLLLDLARVLLVLVLARGLLDRLRRLGVLLHREQHVRLADVRLDCGMGSATGQVAGKRTHHSWDPPRSLAQPP